MVPLTIYQDPRSLLASVRDPLVSRPLEIIRHLRRRGDRHQRSQVPIHQDHHLLRLYPPLVRGPRHLRHSDIHFIKRCKVDCSTHMHPLQFVDEPYVLKCYEVRGPSKCTYRAYTGRSRHWVRILHYGLLLQSINSRNLWRLLIAAAKEWRRNTDTQSKIATNMRMINSLVLRACLHPAFLTASSDWGYSLLIDHFHCLRVFSSYYGGEKSGI